MEKEHHHEEVSIVIDKKHKRSPNPTTGIALYVLGEIPDVYDLFQVVHGHGDDIFIPKDGTTITLKEGENFYSAQSSLNPGAIWKLMK
jgi:hypothetical protein